MKADCIHNRIFLVAGLGNPGEKYAETRHNAGFAAVNKLLDVLNGTFEEQRFHNAVSFTGRCRGGKLILLKPLTFMNLSGEAVKLIASKNKILPQEILLIYDDMDLPLGKIRIRAGGGGSGGHNGVQSVIEELGSADFVRLRIGIGRDEKGSQADFVLSEFSDKEKEIFTDSLEIAAEAAKLILYRGVKEAMNRFNTRR